MGLQALCPDLVAWRIRRIAPERDRLVFSLEPMGSTVACPVCVPPSGRVHRGDLRRPSDLPWWRSPVQLVVQAQRCCGDAPTFLRRMFAEPFPEAFAVVVQQRVRGCSRPQH